MRLFTAIDLPDAIIETLDSLITKLRPAARIAWSPAANFHVTTKFIGEWPEERLDELKDVISRIPSREAIPIRVAGLGFFPNARSPKIFWAGVEGPAELTILAADTDAAVETLGVEREKRKYSPHLTLARIREPLALEKLHAAIKRMPSDEFGSFIADRFYLYRSQLGRVGSVYTKLSEFTL
jgi:RNA 2',3'-cyclic 3'-phosphodiesterase